MKTNLASNYSFTSHSKIPVKVDERLLRGCAVTNPYKIYKLKKQGVTQIIDLRNTSFERPFERFFCRLFGIKYSNHKYSHRLVTIPEHDFFQKINDEIIKNKGQTYIHCQYGKRRTSICTAVYEKFHTNKSDDEILNNLFKLGFMEFEQNPDSYKIKRLRKILMDFLCRYYMPEKF